MTKANEREKLFFLAAFASLLATRPDADLDELVSGAKEGAVRLLREHDREMADPVHTFEED